MADSTVNDLDLKRREDVRLLKVEIDDIINVLTEAQEVADLAKSRSAVSETNFKELASLLHELVPKSQDLYKSVVKIILDN